MMASQRKDPPIALVQDRAPAEFQAPRGPIVSAEWIIRHYHTDPDTGERQVSQKWIRENIPGKVRLSHSMVGWFRDDVVAHYERLARQVMR